MATRPRTPATTAVRKFIKSLGATDDESLVLGKIALNLAAKLDGDAGMATAAVSRELRETVTQLRDLSGGGDDAFEEWEGQLADPD